MNSRTTVARTIGLSATVVLFVSALYVGGASTRAGASSHREAPLISNDAQADTTDVYAFVSPDRQDSVTLIGSWIPLESPEGGPNYYQFGDDVLYAINVDNVGDGKAHISYQFRFSTVRNNLNTFLYNTGPITSLNDPDWNVRQYVTVTEVITNAGVATENVLLANAAVPPVNIGDKSTPDFQALSDAAIHTIGTGPNQIKVFAGQTDDAFWVDLGSIFDLLSLRPQATPIGYPPPRGPSVGLDGLAGYNVHSIAIQLPIARVLQNADPAETTIGVWATSSRYSTRVLAPLGSVTNSGDQVQVSRLGMPLVNEAVLPLALKDAFNGLKPEQDYGLFTSGTAAGDLLASSVLTPELQTLLNALYSVPNPGKPRADILDIFLQGMVTAQPFTITTATGPVQLPAGFNVNRPKSASRQPAEMLRLNTAITGDLCHPTPQRLGVLAGDACGFPNGRRLADDVTEIELLAVAGAAWQALTGDTGFTFNPALINVLSDGLNTNDRPFRPSFPYLAYAHQGQEHVHPYIVRFIYPVMPVDSTTP
jgi:hypothetical protein